jgi:CubicO group peptidase (beta-lactamase class C family)
VQDLDRLRLERRIDHLLAPWSAASTPGCTIGVARAGTVVAHRSAGLANLDLGVPIGPETTFRIASVTKQFTCTAALLLAEEGKLALADEIHAHLPELPDFGARITIDHLMRNTSGIRDFLELMRLGGMDLRAPCALADILQIIGLQRSLNFPPGSRFLYSNTNFLLLGRIVEKLGAEPLGTFVARRILVPLGMTRSRLVASTAETVPGLATGYFPDEGGGFVKAAHGFPLGGEGGLVSSVEDLALWDRNFTTGQVGGKALPAALAEQEPLTDGRPSAYARGLAVQHWRGLATMSHGGLWPGYRTEFLRIPERELTVICIANLGDIVPYRLARQAAEAALEAECALHPLPPPPAAAALEPLAGRYFDATAPASVDIEPGPAGALQLTANGVPFRLIADPDGRLTADASSFEFTAVPAADGLLVGEPPRLFHRAPPAPVLPADLPGRYECDEVGATWTFALDAKGGPTGNIIARAAGPFVTAGPWEVLAVADDIFRVLTPSQLYRSWFDVRLDRASNGAVLSLTVSGGRTRNHVFARIG